MPLQASTAVDRLRGVLDEGKHELIADDLRQQLLKGQQRPIELIELAESNSGLVSAIRERLGAQETTGMFTTRGLM